MLEADLEASYRLVRAYRDLMIADSVSVFYAHSVCRWLHGKSNSGFSLSFVCKYLNLDKKKFKSELLSNCHAVLSVENLIRQLQYYEFCPEFLRVTESDDHDNWTYWVKRTVRAKQIDRVELVSAYCKWTKRKLKACDLRPYVVDEGVTIGLNETYSIKNSKKVKKIESNNGDLFSYYLIE